MTPEEIVLYGFLGSLAAGAMTSVGAAPALLGRAMAPAWSDTLLGFAAGVMLAASFFSLLVPGIEIAAELYGEGATPALIAAAGVGLGAAAIAYLNEALPHEHFFQGREGPDASSLRRVWLLVIAVSLHNAPEGMAVGVSFGSGDLEDGLAVAIGIGLQNAPEGLAVAVALRSAGYSRSRSFVTASLTGMIEPVFGLCGALVVSVSSHVLPWGLSFAAGAMLYVISHEIIPETHRRGHQNLGTLGLIVGLMVMMVLDVWLG